MIDRAVILARGGALDFDLPGAESPAQPAAPRAPAEAADGSPGYFTEAEMRRRERDNLAAVLEKSGGKVKGANGAAELLGVKPTTLVSRLKKLGLTRAG